MNPVYLHVNLNEINDIIYMIKTFFITIYTYYTFLKIIDIKNISKSKILLLTMGCLALSIICCIIRNSSNSITTIICLTFLLSCLYALVNNQKLGHTLLITTISLSITYIIYVISTFLVFIVITFIPIENDYISLLLMLISQGIILFSIFKIKRFKHGIAFLKKHLNDEYFDILILNISIILIFLFNIFNIFTSLSIPVLAGLLFIFIIIALVMVITIYKTITMYYKHNLLVQDLEETKTELESKNKEIAELEQENLKISKTNHSIVHKQKSLEHKLNELALKYEVADEIDIKDELDNISSKYSETIVKNTLPKTEIAKIDDMLNFTQSECIKNNINFDLQINDNIHYMTNNFISIDELEILIADLTKNAIIAIKHSDNINRSILVKLGLIDNCYSLYIYDSGIEFEKETLKNLGRKPCSTHLDDGGSGMGFMNIFDTLNKYEASIEINEISSPTKDNYTKYIAIKFDKKHEFKINSNK